MPLITLTYHIVHRKTNQQKYQQLGMVGMLSVPAPDINRYLIGDDSGFEDRHAETLLISVEK
jgi:hypothetical protein